MLLKEIRMNATKEIQSFKDTLHERQSDLSKLDGKQETLEDTLKEYGFTDFDNLEQSLVDLDLKIEGKETKLKKKVKNFKLKYSTLLGLKAATE